MIAAAVERLSEEQREVVVLKEYQGLTFPEIAEVLSEIATDLYDIFQNEPYRLQDKQMVSLYVKKGFMLKEGIFSAFYVVAFALGVPAILVASGFGLSERKNEIGIMKATGWQTLEVLELISMEQLLISLLGATIALLLSILWLKGFNVRLSRSFL